MTPKERPRPSFLERGRLYLSINLPVADYWIFPTPTWPGRPDGRPDAESSV